MKRVRLMAFGTALVGLAVVGWMRTHVSAGPTEDAAVERARREIKMLDDLYKTAVVLVTENYVQEDSDLPAGTAAKKLFEAMKAKGWHDVRLIDATGQPIEEDNAPREGFEQTALKKLQAGAGFVDEVTKINGKRYLLAATPIPVVLDKCIMCHDHYKTFKAEGKIIGALGYTVPVDR